LAGTASSGFPLGYKSASMVHSLNDAIKFTITS